MGKNRSRTLGVAQGEVCTVPCFNLDLVRRLRAALPSDEALEESRVLFAALADRTRLKILFSLRGGEELCVCDVAHVLGASVATASHHLRKLRDLGLLQYRNDGKMMYYSLRNPFAAALVAQALETPSHGRRTPGTTSRVHAADARRSAR